MEDLSAFANEEGGPPSSVSVGIAELTSLRETRAYVDLDAIEHNLRLLTSRAPGVSVMPAVKADAYGHGIEAVGATAVRCGVDMLAVACLEEYMILRDQGIALPILILEDLFPDEVLPALQAGARLNVSTTEYARMLDGAASRAGTTATIHVNLDTGMGRMGLFSDDPVRDLMGISRLPNTVVEGVYTHFPGADEADKTFALEQISRFTAILTQAKAHGLVPRYRHAANSGALIDFPDRAAFDLVRPGISMYGIFPSREVDQTPAIMPVMKVVSRIVKVTRYDRAWTVGYGRTWNAPPGSVIGIVPIGYGDGYPRLLSNRGEVLVRGRRVSVAGRVSMDMIAVDLTSIAGEVRVGEEVVLLGSSGEERIDAMELADLTGTIPYEITCGLTPRVPRIYLRNDTPVAIRTQRRGYRRIT